MKPTWILIANAAHARLLQQEPARQLVLLHSMEHPASRMRSSELGDASAGRQLADRAFGAAAFETRIDPQRKEHLHFAHELAQVLEEGAQGQRCDAVHLFSSSPFLGELKHALGPATRRLLAGTHDVDLTTVGLTELPARLEHELS